jgi:hypothetical protein
MQSAGNQSSVAPRAANRLWIWFFLLLAVAGGFAVVVPLVYNLWQQLQPEPLEQARQRWEENGPRDYDLLWEEKVNEAPRPTQYLAVVRDGKVWMVHIDHDVLLARELATPLGGAVGTPAAALHQDSLMKGAANSLGATLGPTATTLMTVRPPQRDLTGYTVEGLFHTIDENLKKNAESGGRNFATATFDKNDGHPTHYVYRVRRTPERLEWNVKLLRP